MSASTGKRAPPRAATSRRAHAEGPFGPAAGFVSRRHLRCAAVGRLVSALPRSRFHQLVPKSIDPVRYTRRRSGRRIMKSTQYASGGGKRDRFRPVGVPTITEQSSSSTDRSSVRRHGGRCRSCATTSCSRVGRPGSPGGATGSMPTRNCWRWVSRTCHPGCRKDSPFRPVPAGQRCRHPSAARHSWCHWWPRPSSSWHCWQCARCWRSSRGWRSPP